MINYELEVHTGTDKDAGSTSQVYCQLFGSRGDSGRRKLLPPSGKAVKYEPGQVDKFRLEAVDLGDLSKIIIGETIQT